MDETFIQFGCWNNLNVENNKTVGGLQTVMDAIKKYAREKHPRFLIISGDNYYPQKEKSEDGTTLGEMVYPVNLQAGFDLLPNNLNIHMILGNHDLQTNREKSKSLKIVEDPIRDEDKTCEILQMEKANIKANIEFSFFKHIMLSNGTLVLMIDTSIYENDSESYLPCYQVFFGNKTVTLEQLIMYQKRLIREAIQQNKRKIKNIILVGHHPILYLKYKEEKDKTKKDKSEKSAKEKSDKPDKEKLAKEKPKGVIIRSDIHIKPLLEEIFTILPDVKYHYLCSDLHLYQKGKITINFGGKEMKIQQYIVGTGGTKLDKSIPDKNLKVYIEDNPVSSENGIQYVFEEEIEHFGFLECVNSASGPSFKFINADKPNTYDTPYDTYDVIGEDPLFKKLILGGKKTKKQKNKQNKTNKKWRRNV